MTRKPTTHFIECDLSVQDSLSTKIRVFSILRIILNLPNDDWNY